MPPVTEIVLLVVFLLVIGAVAGVLAGLLGVGGGIVLVPAFYYTFTHLGYDSPMLMQICLGTSLATIVFTSIRSVRAHHRRGSVDVALLRAWAPAIVVGALLGTATASILRSATLTLIFGVLALVAGLYMAFGRSQWQLAPAMPRGPRLQAYGGLLGYFSVLMGIGGGTFGVPLMTLHGKTIHQAVGTAAGLGLIIALPSTLGFLLIWPANAPPWTIGAINLPAFAVVLVTLTICTPLGVRIAHAMNPAPLKRAFGVFILIVAANMLRKAAGF